MWTLGNGIPAMLLIPLAITLLTALSTSLANNTAAYQLVQWVVIVAAGGLISLASTFVMRGFIKRTRLWFLMTWAGWAVALVYPATPMFFQYYSPTGSVPNSIQVYSQAASILSAAIKFILIGFTQWLVLRIDYRRAWRWMLWYTAGIAVAIALLLAGLYVFHLDTLLANTGNSQLYSWISNGATYLIGFAIVGIGLHGILDTPILEEKDEEGSLVAAEWAGAVLLNSILLTAMQASGLLTLLLSPFQSNQTVQRYFTYFWVGLIMGFTQWLVLRKRTTLAIAWGLATLLATILARAAIYGVGNSIQPGTSLATAASNPLIFSVIITIISALVISAAQASILAWRGYTRYWFWFTLQITAMVVAFLATYFINQVLGLAITGAITGLTIAVVLLSRSLETWVALPSGDAPGDDHMDEDGKIISQRFRQAFGRRSAVTVFDDCMEINPGEETDPELAMRLVTGRGMAQIFTNPLPPVEDQPAPEEATTVLSQDSIASATVLEASDPDNVRLQLAPTDEGLDLLEAFRKAGPEKPLYLAVDGSVVIATPLEVGEEDALELSGLAADEAATLAAMLDNNPLSTVYRIEEE